MKIDPYMLSLVLAVIGSAGFTAVVSSILNRRKNKADTTSVIVTTYGNMMDDLRDQVRYQGDQIKALQEREVQYLKIINEHHEEKKQLIAKHAAVERDLQDKIKALETKLSKRIQNLETNQ